MPWNTNSLESIPCDLCGATEFRSVFTRPDGMTVVECSCGLAFLCPRPKGNLISRLYDREYFQKEKTGQNLGYCDYLSEANRQVRLDHHAEVLRTLGETVALRGMRCLEVGCATGEFAHVAQKHGANMHAIDLSAEVVAIASKRYPDVAFSSGEVETLPLDGTFDVIFGFEVIEHVPSPRAFLTSLGERLAPGGTLVLSTPNYAGAKRLGHSHWAGFNGSFEHLYYFDVETLTKYGAPLGLTLGTFFTGGGDGKYPENRSRSFLRALLQRMKLMGILRRLRGREGVLPSRYVSGGDRYDLLVVFSKDNV